MVSRDNQCCVCFGRKKPKVVKICMCEGRGEFVCGLVRER